MTGHIRAIARVVAVVVALASTGSCTSDPGIESAGLEEALAAAGSIADDRPAVLERLGTPDSFQVTYDEFEGVPVRFESWSYHDLGSRIDFVDGTVAWNIEIDDLPDGSLLPIWYAPSDFELLMTLDEARAVAVDLSPADQTPTAIDLSDGGEDYEGTVLLAGDQVLLGFVDDVLVFVETFALSADDGGGL